MRRALFIGVDLQRDFASPGGALEIEGAASAVATASRLISHARSRTIPVLLSRDTHEEDEFAVDGLPPHNIIGTKGHDLVEEIEIEDSLEIPNTYLSEIETRGDRVLVIDSPDHRRGIFGNVNIDRLLTSLDVEEHVIFGIPTEIGIRSTGLGLLERGRTTILVSDGLAHLDAASAASQLAALAGAGCRFLTADKIIERYS